MSVYIHIPFCSNICSYCDFCKFYYNESWVDNYLSELEKEINFNYKNDVIKTIYIGGGTPSCLNINQLKKLLEITQKFKTDLVEFTFECNIDITEEKLILLKENGVNRISLGIQTVNDKLLKIIERNHTKEEVINKINLIKKYFNNINVDLMYALPGETIDDLKTDLEFFINLEVSHISTYSLILEPNTKLYISNVSNIDEDIDYEMYKLINDTLIKNGFDNYEISNYSKKGYESKHNLVYWNNQEYYGFGIGASGYVDGVRYDNTRSYRKYINGKYISNSHKLSKKEKIENEFILGFRKLEGINILDFNDKFDMDILSISVVNDLLNENKLILDNNYLKINKEHIYTSNSILVNFIDMGEE